MSPFDRDSTVSPTNEPWTRNWPMNRESVTFPVQWPIGFWKHWFSASIWRLREKQLANSSTPCLEMVWQEKTARLIQNESYSLRNDLIKLYIKCLSTEHWSWQLAYIICLECTVGNLYTLVILVWLYQQNHLHLSIFMRSMAEGFFTNKLTYTWYIYHQASGIRSDINPSPPPKSQFQTSPKR